ncbi:3'-5' exonuclease [Bacteroidia bacterium]|nr:3'-5' exonuclease [Bacteroidia bacterium]
MVADLAVEALGEEVQVEAGNLFLQDILFIDIETVPQAEDYDKLSTPWQKLWDKKAARLAQNDESPQELYPRAGIYAEFGKIICVSVGFIAEAGDQRSFRVKSFYGEDEKQLLQEFCDLLHHNYFSKTHFLCAHNGKEFDFPYLCRRILVNDIEMPDILDLAGKKPWDVKHLDTMQLWKFGDFKSYTSLGLLATLFGIETPKGDIDGSDIYEVYYQDKDLERIRLYCERDVVTLAGIYLRMNGMPHIKQDEVKKV